jgi:hypothetical protein
MWALGVADNKIGDAGAAALGEAANSIKKHSSIRLHKLTEVYSEEVKASDSDLAVLGLKNWSWWSPRCKRVVVIVDADSLVRGSGRNPLTKYTPRTRTREFLTHDLTTLAIVNATCKTMLQDISDDRIGRMEECQHSRTATFKEFLKGLSHLIPKTTPVKDIPPAAELSSGQNHFELLFTNVEYDSPNDHDNYSPKLQTRGNQATDKVCQFGHKESQMIRGNFPKFQIVLVGKEGAGKSTTATWLAHHLKTVESLRNMFTSASGDSSFTREFNMVQFTPTISVADTLGLPELKFKSLCGIKRLLDGTLVEKNGAAMKWSEHEDKMCKNSWLYVLSTWIFCVCIAGFSLFGVCNYMYPPPNGEHSEHANLVRRGLKGGLVVVFLWILVYFGWRKNVENVSELTCCESQIIQNRDLQAHAILFMIRYHPGDQKEIIRTFLQKMKQVVHHGSDFNFDVMNRMVFGISDAPSDDQKFNEWVKDLGLPAKDVFAIRWSSISTENTFIPPGTLFPILKRLQEKACTFFLDEIEAGRVTEPFSWGLGAFGGMIVIVLLILSRFSFTIQVLFVFGFSYVRLPSSPCFSYPLLLSHVSTSLPSSESLPLSNMATDSTMKVSLASLAVLFWVVSLGRMLRGGRGERTRATRISRWRCRMRNGAARTKFVLAPCASRKYPQRTVLSVRGTLTTFSVPPVLAARCRGFSKMCRRRYPGRSTERKEGVSSVQLYSSAMHRTMKERLQQFYLTRSSRNTALRRML